MSVLADSSGLIAVADPEQEAHGACLDAFAGLKTRRPLLTTNYIVAESLGLIQRRYRLGKAATFVRELLSVLRVEFVDQRVHELGLASFLAANRRGDSFVDHVTFAFMRDRGITTAFTLDQDFARAGFEVVP